MNQVQSATSAVTPSTALPSICLEIDLGKSKKLLNFPVSLKNLSDGMLTLEARNLWFPDIPETLTGKKAILRLTLPGSQETMNLAGTMAWTRSAPSLKSHLNLGMKFVKPDNHAKKVLENLLPSGKQDVKRLWDLWDESRTTEEPISTNVRNNLTLIWLGCGALVSSFMEPQIIRYIMWALFGLLSSRKIFLDLRSTSSHYS